VGETEHKSVLIVTSREKPHEFRHLEGATYPVRTLMLEGIDHVASKAMLQDKDKKLYGSDDDWASLVDIHSGNPLALKLTADTIRDISAGNISKFLSEGGAIFGDVLGILAEQFERLSLLELHLMYWLAIEREPVAIDEVRNLLVAPMDKRTVPAAALGSLGRRSLVEWSLTGPTLQHMVLEYTLERLLEQIIDEIQQNSVSLFNSHRLLNAQAHDDIRHAQETFILKPIYKRLLNSGTNTAEQQLRNLLANLHANFHDRNGYAAGNLLNLLLYMGYDVHDFDFSHLRIWYPFLREKPVRGLNLSSAHIKRPALADIFEPLLTIAFDPSQPTMIAAVTETGIIRIWDSASSKQLFMLESTGNAVISLAYRPDGTLLASGGKDEVVRLWEARTGEYRQILDVAIDKTDKNHRSPIRAVSFSADGLLLASSNEDGVVCIWGCDDEAGTNWTSLSYREPSSASEPVRHKDIFHPIAFYPGSTDLSRNHWLALTNDSAVEVWDVDNWQRIHRYELPDGRVRSLAFSPDGAFLAAGSDENAIYIWDIQSPETPPRSLSTTAIPHSIAFGPDSKLFAAGNEQGIDLWDTQTWKLRSPENNTRPAVSSVAFNADGTRLAGSCADRKIHFWHAETGHPEGKALQAYNRRVRSIALDATNTYLVSGGGDNKVYLWNYKTMKQIAELEEHKDRVWSVNIGPDGSTVASTSDDGAIVLWDLQTGMLEERQSLSEHNKPVWATAFSPDGAFLASSSDDTTVRLWDLRQNVCIKVFYGHEKRVRSVAFNPNGKQIASASNDGQIRVWNVESTWDEKVEPCLHTIDSGAERVRSVVFSPCGTLLASGGSNPAEVRLWDSFSGKYLCTLSKGHDDTVWCVAFSPDGTHLASSSQDLTIRVWDLKTKACVAVLNGPQGHSGWVRSITFTADGSRILSCGEDGKIKTWDISSEECIQSVYADTRYAGTNIKGVVGLSDEERDIMRLLGAVEE
jgi:WD40 repeat protein